MRNEHAKHDVYPVGIRFLSIKNYPLSWRDATQLIWVLKGKLNVSVENEKYTLLENQVDIINVNEVYCFNSDEDNAILIIDIDPKFFERYYEDSGEVFYYTSGSQNTEKYNVLKEYMAKISYEVYKELEDYEEEVEQETLSLMYHLLNEFHYLYYEGGTENWDIDNFERSHRIVKYISNHYAEKASLQDLANQEFLSSPYLSYKIKETFGESFNEYLNRIRVEESTKLLLDTSKSLTEIAEEVGFSHVRYYNKHFLANYGMSPSKYRKEYKVPKKTYESSHIYKELPYENLFEAIHPILLNYPRYEYDNKIFKLDINLDSKPIAHYIKPEIIDLGNVSLLLEEENQRLFRELQRELNFKSAILRGMFSEDMDIYKGGNHRFINWTRVESLLEFLEEMEIEPIIFVEGVDREVIDSFINYFEERFPNIEDSLKDTVFSDNLYENHIIYDRMEMALYLLEAFTKRSNAMIPTFVDEITRNIILDNETFFGGKGLFTNNFLKKPSYYAFMLLSILGEEIIYQGEGVFITKSDKGFEMLLIHPFLDEEYDFFNLQGKIFPERRFSLNFRNMSSDFIITRYSLNSEEGSVYDKWIGLNSPERLEEDEWELLKEYIHPSVKFFSQEKVPVYNVFEKLPFLGAVLYVIREKE